MEPYYKVEQPNKRTPRWHIRDANGDLVRLNIGGLVFVDEEQALDLCAAMNLGRHRRLNPAKEFLEGLGQT